MPITRTERNLWSAFIDEAKANQMYEAYAIKAMEEGYPEVAQVFKEASGSESIHGLTHLRVAGEVRSTVENLVSVIAGEAEEMDVIYPRRIREADEEGRHDASASFKMALDRERYHVRMLRLALNDLLRQHPELKSVASHAGQPSAPPQEESSDGAPSPAELVELSGQAPPSVRTEVFQEKERVGALQRLREVMFGAQDGLVSTLAVVSSVAIATGESSIAIIAGATSGLAGTVSMAAGSYLGSRAELEIHSSELEMEAREIREHPAEEMAELIAIYQREGMSYDEAITMAERVASDRAFWLRTMAEKELGLSVEPTVSPLKDSLTMGASFFAAATVPMVLYFFLPARTAVIPSMGLTLAVLFLVGVGKGRLLRRQPLISGLEVTAIGTLSGFLGYLAGTLLPQLLAILPVE